MMPTQLVKSKKEPRTMMIPDRGLNVLPTSRSSYSTAGE